LTCAAALFRDGHGPAVARAAHDFAALLGDHGIARGERFVEGQKGARISRAARDHRENSQVLVRYRLGDAKLFSATGTFRHASKTDADQKRAGQGSHRHERADYSVLQQILLDSVHASLPDCGSRCGRHAITLVLRTRGRLFLALFSGWGRAGEAG
jgi:hypothetical protein